MRVHFDSPREDYWKLLGTPIFDNEGKPTERAIAGLENLLAAYSQVSPLHAKNSDNNISNYEVTSVSLVGSGADRNEPNSDIDFLFIVPRLDIGSANAVKTVLAMMFYCDRNKESAIDVFIRKEDAYPNRANIDITSYTEVKKLLDNYMDRMLI
jgi:hypothetical protein